MGWAFVSSLVHVHLHGPIGINREALVRVDSDAEQSGISVNQLVLVSYNRVPQDASIVEIGKIGHVDTAIKLRWINLSNCIFLENLDLKI